MMLTDQERKSLIQQAKSLPKYGFEVMLIPENKGCVSLYMKRLVGDGTMVLRIELKDYQTGADVVITVIGVEPHVRRQGHATKAVSDLITWARANGLNGEIRATLVKKSAEPFWEHVGFLAANNITHDFIFVE